MNHYINEWQDISLKKDVEVIAKQQRSKNKGTLIITSDILLAVFVLVTELIFDVLDVDEGSPSIARIGIIAVLILVGAGLFIWAIIDYTSINRENKRLIKNRSLPISRDVDLFDNKICYCAMTASTMYDAFLAINPSENEEEKVFYYIETNYYINKCIQELEHLGNDYAHIFTKDVRAVVNQQKIHATRLENIIDMLRGIRAGLATVQEVVSPKIDATKALAEQYDIIMMEFVKSYNKCDSLDDLIWI